MPGISDPNWWPTPVQREPKTIGNLVLNGWLAPVVVGVAVVALVLALSGHHAAKPTTTTPAKTVPAPAAQTPQEREAALQQAFRDCLRQAGASGGGFGRFGQPSRDKIRTAFSLCRSALQAPATPATPASAPVA